MISITKINISIIITSIFFLTSIFLTKELLESELWYSLTNVRIDFYYLFNNFIFYLIIDVVGIALIIYMLKSLIKDAKNNNGKDIIKSKTYRLKKELNAMTLILLVVLILGFLIEEVKYFNIIFIPITLIFVLSSYVFVILMNKYVLK